MIVDGQEYVVLDLDVLAALDDRDRLAMIEGLRDGGLMAVAPRAIGPARGDGPAPVPAPIGETIDGLTVIREVAPTLGRPRPGKGRRLNRRVKVLCGSCQSTSDVRLGNIRSGRARCLHCLKAAG